MTPYRELDFLPRPDLERLQRARLAQLVGYVFERVPFYRQRLCAAGVAPGSIADQRDIVRLPFTCKADLRDHYPFGLFAVAPAAIARIHASTGTTGKPTVVGYTRPDLDTWAELCARCLILSGARPGQVFQNAYGYGLFTGGLGLHAGAERVGLTVIPASAGNTARQLLLMEDLGTEILACTPSYALTLADALAERGIDRGRLRLQTLVLGAEPWTDAMRSEIEARLAVHALNIYGLSEVIGPGVANECVEAKQGSHVFEDHFLVEVIDPQTGLPVPDGTVGELVFTTLTKQALPLLRYRTGDLASLTREPCPCGRTLARMSRIVGRTDDMLIIRGVNLFPSQVEAALLTIEHLTPHHQIVVTRDQRLDELEISVEVTPFFFQQSGRGALDEAASAPSHGWLALQVQVERLLRDALGVACRLRLLPPSTLPRSDGGKIKRVIDRRLPSTELPSRLHEPPTKGD